MEETYETHLIIKLVLVSMKLCLSYVTVIQWITSCHNNVMTACYITLLSGISKVIMMYFTTTEIIMEI